MAKKPKAPEKDNSERWLLTYSDLMNLLLILFIIFYAISQIDKEKAEKLAEGMSKAFGGYVEDGGTGESEGEGTGLYGDSMDPEASASADASGNSEDTYWTQQQEQAFSNFYDEVVQLLKNNNLQDMVDVKLNDSDVVISFKDNVLFASGQADLGVSSMNLIDSIGKLLTTLNFSFILVEGHTDTDPVNASSKYIDNMDLSSHRAGNVWRELVKMGLPAEKMASIGYGETRPVKENDTPENKAKNRRVVITIMRDITSAGELITNPSGEPTVVTPETSSGAVAGAAAGS
jgi:chemotaxis protein MotB